MSTLDSWIDAEGRIYNPATCGVHAVAGPTGTACPICETYEISSALKHGILKERFDNEPSKEEP